MVEHNEDKNTECALNVKDTSKKPFNIIVKSDEIKI